MGRISDAALIELVRYIISNMQTMNQEIFTKYLLSVNY